ncbi:MAG: hypothetical protein ACRC9L_02125 [Brevinema sp.]
MNWNDLSSLSSFGDWGVVLAFCGVFGSGFVFVYKELKEQNRLRQQREDNRKQEHEKEILMLSANLEKISKRLENNDTRTDFAESLGLYAHERLDEHLNEKQLSILKKASRSTSSRETKE